MAQRGTTAKIDLAELERLSAMQYTDEEIAAWFGVTTRTIERRRKKRPFAEVMDRGKAKGRISVRRAQLKLLEAGNATMGVWLGKQILGQSDFMHTQISGNGLITLAVFDSLLREHRAPEMGPRALPQQASGEKDKTCPVLITEDGVCSR